MRKVIISLALVVLLSFSSFGLNIFYDNFDNNLARLNGWKESSSTNVVKNTSTATKVGTACMQIKYNGNVTAYINVKPYKNMVLTFRMAKYSLETGEKIVCQYMTGTTWVTAATKLNTASSSAYTSYSVSIPAATTLKIRFILNGSATDDTAYIDEVKLVGDRK